MTTYIPFNRVEDFIAGWTRANDSFVKWIVAARIRGIQVERPQIDFYMKYIYYECAFGLKDHIWDLQHPHSKKFGCIAKFSIKQLFFFSCLVEVAYYHVEHIKEDESLAHGWEDKFSIRR